MLLFDRAQCVCVVFHGKDLYFLRHETTTITVFAVSQLVIYLQLQEEEAI